MPETKIMIQPIGIFQESKLDKREVPTKARGYVSFVEGSDLTEVLCAQMFSSDEKAALDLKDTRQAHYNAWFPDGWVTEFKDEIVTLPQTYSVKERTNPID